MAEVGKVLHFEDMGICRRCKQVICAIDLSPVITLIIPRVRNKHSQEHSHAFNYAFFGYLSLDFMGRLWSWMGKQFSAWKSQHTQVCLGVSQPFLGNGSHMNSMQRGNSPVLYSEYLICYLFGIFCVSAFSRFFSSCFYFQLFQHIACRTLVHWSHIKVTQSYDIRVCLKSSLFSLYMQLPLIALTSLLQINLDFS